MKPLSSFKKWLLNILVPYIEPEDWLTELESLAEATLELQT